jgi:hypothetical protein
MINLKRRMAFLTVPAVLAVGAMSYGSLVAFASPSPNPSPAGTSASAAAEPAESATESATAPETAEPNEPALPGGGYADAAGAQVDTQQEGVH